VSVGKKAGSISDELVTRFCKNSMFLKVVQYVTFAQESTTLASEEIKYELANADSDAVYYYIKRAVNKFRETEGRLPGSKGHIEGINDENYTDTCILHSYLTNIMTKHGLESGAYKPQISEMYPYLTPVCDPTGARSITLRH
jgi:hypothetical protein